MTFQVLEILEIKIQDFPAGVGTLKVSAVTVEPLRANCYKQQYGRSVWRKFRQSN